MATNHRLVFVNRAVITLNYEKKIQLKHLPSKCHLHVCAAEQ